MTIKKDIAIQNILADFEKLANTVLEQLDKMELFITSGESNIPEEVLSSLNANEERINESEVKISDKIINTIVLQSPLASELRKLISCYRILINLERTGDRVMNITRLVKKINAPELYDSFNDVFSHTAILSVKMIRRAFLAFINNDIELAIWVIKNDDVMDEINGKILKKLVKKIKVEEASKNLLSSAITMKELMSNLERIGDYATNIAEAAIYSIKGEDIRHQDIDEEEKEEEK